MFVAYWTIGSGKIDRTMKSSEKPNKTKVIVCGAGIGGLTLVHELSVVEQSAVLL